MAASVDAGGNLPTGAAPQPAPASVSSGILAASRVTPDRILTAHAWIATTGGGANARPIAATDVDYRRCRSRAARHTLVVETLRRTATADQHALLTWLGQLAAAGHPVTCTPHWIANVITIRAPATLLVEIARHPQVDWLQGALRGRSLTPVAGNTRPPGPTDPSTSRHTHGDPAQPPRLPLPAGLRAIHADLVWHERGYCGNGRLIGLLDTGVDGEHPGLAPSWRGNTTPAASAWLDLVHGSPTPHDVYGHGTRVLGIATGLNQITADTTGVAWGAQWIAAAAIGQSTGAEYDTDVIAAFEWLADPDGNPATIDDVPDVVIGAFGVEPALPGDPPYESCDGRFQQVIDNLELGGTVMVWSAGNSGPLPGSVASPADLGDGTGRNLAVGAVDATHSSFPYPVTDTSSRGPSDCDGNATKPDLVAPGLSVRTTFPGATVGHFSGTSAAVPHIGGVVALMREVAPDLPVATLKELLLAATIDLGQPGPDNDSGAGLIDARLAVDLVIAQTIGIPDAAPPALLRLGPPQPNPSRGAVTFTAHLTEQRPVWLEVYTVGGQRLRRLDCGLPAAGSLELVWDGRDAAGRRVAAGVYFIRVFAGTTIQRKAVLVR